MAKKKKDSGNGGVLTATGLLWRFIIALALVLLTFNPSGESADHWISKAIVDRDFEPLHLILVAVLSIGWVVYWVSTWRALGGLGVGLAALLLGGIIWLLFDIGLLESHSVDAITWISLVCLSAVLAIGVSWSHFWRRLTGQYNVEDVDD